jgi:hypothetical protein
MQIHHDALLKLTEKHLECAMLIPGRQYGVKATVSYSEVPVTRPTTRGGVYFADKMAFKIKANVSDESLAEVLSKTMLGPSADFERIEFLICVPVALKIFAHLTNYVQKGDGLELNLVVVGTKLAN